MPVFYLTPFVFRPMAWAADAAGSHPAQLVIIGLSVTAAASAGTATAMAVAARRRDRRSEEGPQP